MRHPAMAIADCQNGNAATEIFILFRTRRARARFVKSASVTMAYVITEPCIDVKDGDCTLACPVDCIYEGGRMFYIHPDECVNCGLCLSICPVDAIVWDGEIAETMAPFSSDQPRVLRGGVTGWGVARRLGRPAYDDARPSRCRRQPAAHMETAVKG